MSYKIRIVKINKKSINKLKKKNWIWRFYKISDCIMSPLLCLIYKLNDAKVYKNRIYNGMHIKRIEIISFNKI